MITKIGLKEAINSLTPKVSFTFNNNGIDEWDLDNSGTTKPSQAEIDAEVIRLQAEFNALQYQRDRQYLSWQEQMDQQYWDSVNGTNTWKDAIAKVKSDNPKPE